MTTYNSLLNAAKKTGLVLVLGLISAMPVGRSASAQIVAKQPAIANESNLVLDDDREWKIKHSLFFLPNEVIAVMQARRGILQSKASYEDNPTEAGPRYISLAGISYVDANDWTIWLNDEKITPNNIPERIIDLVVHKDYINIKWHDVVKQRIVVFTLKPHQRFHLDTGLLLPG